MLMAQAGLQDCSFLFSIDSYTCINHVFSTIPDSGKLSLSHVLLLGRLPSRWWGELYVVEANGKKLQHCCVLSHYTVTVTLLCWLLFSALDFWLHTCLVGWEGVVSHATDSEMSKWPFVSLCVLGHGHPCYFTLPHGGAAGSLLKMIFVMMHEWP